MVLCFRTITGDEILAEIISENETQITFKNPIAMVMTPTQELAGIPWLQLAASHNQPRTIRKEHILIVYEPNRDVVSNYQQQTSNIITAPANALNQLEHKR